MTTVKIPITLIKLGISPIVIAAIIVVNTGLKEEIGETREIPEKEMAKKYEIDPTVSKMLEKKHQRIKLRRRDWHAA